MPRTKKRTCTVTGVTTSINNFYKNQNHVKAVDNLRRVTGATKNQMTRMFNQLATYSLTVNYGFDISMSYIRNTQLTPWGEQNNRPTPTLFSGILTSNNIQKNSWSIDSDFPSSNNPSIFILDLNL